MSEHTKQTEDPDLFALDEVDEVVEVDESKRPKDDTRPTKDVNSHKRNTSSGKKHAQQTDGGLSRRDFIAGSAGAVVMLGLGGAAVLTPTDSQILRPPGGQDEDRFIGTCIRCDRCRSSCPRNAIEVTGIEAGLINMRTARLDYRSGRITSGFEALHSYEDPYEGLLAAEGGGFCDFCGLCIKNCPTGSLQDFDPETQWIGEAVVVPDLCIAFEKIGGCRKCVDYCPFGAIVLDELKCPVVLPEKCNGCGVCENICPTSSFRTLNGLSERGINVKPNTQGRPQ